MVGGAVAHPATTQRQAQGMEIIHGNERRMLTAECWAELPSVVCDNQRKCTPLNTPKKPLQI
jgi:hypothetical protein